MRAEIDPAEMAAAKAEIRAAMIRRYAEDGRSPAAVYGAMATVTAELLAEMTAAAARDEAHVRSLCVIMCALIENHAVKVWQTKAAKAG